MGKITSEKFYEIAARWWADQIREPVTGSYEDKKEQFRLNLIEIISRDIDPIYQYLQLETAFYPDKRLEQAAMQSGIDIRDFPWDAVMWIDEKGKRINTRVGNNSKEIQIYPMP